jgi:site-specific recombinase XerC
MINRANWKLVNAYLDYRREVDQISVTSQRLEESRLRQVLEWADDKPFASAPYNRPVFPEYVVKVRIEGKGVTLSPVYVGHVIGTAHAFFRWLPKHRHGFTAITEEWLDTMKPPRMTVEHKEHEAVTLDEVKAIAAAPALTLAERRIKAAACFWFLSGIRIGAFVTLPLVAVNLDSLTVKQWPRLGVKTKFSKHATTYLLNIAELLGVVRAWDEEVRAVCQDNGLWFAQVSPDTGKIIKNASSAGVHRGQIATRDLRKWLKRVDLTYHSPHKFRHGHAVYALKMAKDVSALKAVSQNLMHENLSITDGVYGILSESDVRQQIATLGNSVANSEDVQELRLLVSRLLANLERSGAT